jgi:hypothetical protein
MNKLLKRIVVTLVLLPAAFALAEDKPKDKAADKKEKKQVPQGYEDAGTAGERPAPRARAAVNLNVKAAVGAAVELDLEMANDKVDANVKNLEKQFLPQFQSLVKSEQAFLRRVCQLKKPQRKQIADESAKVLKAAARKYAVVQNQMQRGQWRFGGAGQPTMPEPQKLIEQGILQIAKAHLEPAQVEAYQQEVAKRNEYRRSVAVKGLVARLDEELVLSAQQREKLIKSLSENWQDAWVQSLQVLMQNNIQYLPNIPNQHIVPVLNKTQQTVWRGTQKHNQVFWGGFGFAPAMVVIDDGAFDVEELAEEEPADE